MGAPHCKAVLVQKKLSIKSEPKMAVFPELQGLNVIFCFSDPEKTHPCAEPRRLTYYA